MVPGAKAVAVVAVVLTAGCREPRVYEIEPEPNDLTAGSAEPFARYPTLDAPGRVTRGQEFALAVSLTESVVTPDVRVTEGGTDGGSAIDLSGLPASENQWTLDVVLAAPGFALRDGRNAAAITLPRVGDSTRAVFWLTAEEAETAEIERPIYVTFWHKNRFIAKAVRKLSVDEQAEPVTTAGADAGASIPPQKLTLDLAPVSADLTVIFIDNKNGTANVILGSPHIQYAHGSLPLDPANLRWIESQLQKITVHSTRGVKAAGEAAAPPRKELTLPLLEGFGRDLYTKVAPEIFKLAFWHLMDEHERAFDSIQIISDVTGIPWELMRPSRPDGTDQQGFLGVEFRIARWHLNQVHSTLPSPPQTLAFRDLAAVAPVYSGGQNLPGQEAELIALAGVEGYRLVPGSLESFRALFASPPAGFVHFAGHGRVDSSSGINDFLLLLEDAEVDVSTFRGLFSKTSTTHPFVFLNACHLGGAQAVASFVNGWAPAVLEGGGSGYIGALWPVSDAGAAAMGAHFYHELDRALDEGPAAVGDVLRSGRSLFYEDGDPSFLAYVYYGDPNFVVERKH
jgi:CHAT domain